MKNMDISYELYKVFYYVAHTLSFSAASKELYISQSAVSQSIKTLEHKMGQKLFIRSTKRVSLTPEGEILLRHIEPAIHLIQKGESQIIESTGAGGQIRIAASDTICRYYLLPYLQKYHKDFPSVHIKLINASSLNCVDLLHEGQVDLIVVNYPNKNISSATATHRIKEFTDVFVAGPAFSQLKDVLVTFEQIANYPVLLLDKESTTSDFLHQEFQKHHLDLIPEIELVSNDLLMELAMIGLGIAFIPDYALINHREDLFTIRTKEPLPPRELILAYHEELPLTKPTQEFLKMFPVEL